MFNEHVYAYEKQFAVISFIAGERNSVRRFRTYEEYGAFLRSERQ